MIVPPTFSGGLQTQSRLFTVEGALGWARQTLEHLPSATLDARVLLSYASDMSHAELVAHPERRLSPTVLEYFERAVRRRGTGEPVAYIRGFVDWYDLRLLVDLAVLIPRPETELLLEAALQIAPRDLARAADIGTGSGALAIGLARALPGTHVTAVDISPPALRVARRNVERYGLQPRMTLVEGSLLDRVVDEPGLIVANLPYLSDEMMLDIDLPVRHEPAVALHGGASGLELYERLLLQIANRGWKAPILLEIDPRQSRGIRGLAARILPSSRLSILPDYAGRDRVVVIEKVEASVEHA